MSPFLSKISSIGSPTSGFAGPRYITSTYSITPSTTSVNEGSYVTFNVTASNSLTTGNVLYWTTTGSVNSSDFTDGVTSGSVTLTNGSANISRTLTSDSTTEGSESFQLELRSGSTSGVILATSATVTVNDTSTTPSGGGGGGGYVPPPYTPPVNGYFNYNGRGGNPPTDYFSVGVNRSYSEVYTYFYYSVSFSGYGSFDSYNGNPPSGTFYGGAGYAALVLPAPHGDGSIYVTISAAGYSTFYYQMYINGLYD
jgi:hypothetical protein